MARSYNRTWREGGYVIDFKVGQSFGEPQGKIPSLEELLRAVAETRAEYREKILDARRGKRKS